MAHHETKVTVPAVWRVLMQLYDADGDALAHCDRAPVPAPPAEAHNADPTPYRKDQRTVVATFPGVDPQTWVDVRITSDNGGYWFEGVLFVNGQDVDADEVMDEVQDFHVMDPSSGDTYDVEVAVDLADRTGEPIHPALVARYVESGGSFCPYCGSAGISVAGNPEAYDDVALARVDCGECGSSWREEFTMSGVLTA